MRAWIRHKNDASFAIAMGREIAIPHIISNAVTSITDSHCRPHRCKLHYASSCRPEWLRATIHKSPYFYARRHSQTLSPAWDETGMAEGRAGWGAQRDGAACEDGGPVCCSLMLCSHISQRMYNVGVAG